MKRATGILALVLIASLLGAADVRAGSAGAPAGKTSGPSVTAAIVIDLTGPGGTPGKGLSSIRIQRSGAGAGAFFVSGLISTWVPECATIVGETNFRFVGKMNGWVPAEALTALFGGTLGNKAVITDTDYAACTDVSDGAGGTRHVLSFTAVIQFEK